MKCKLSDVVEFNPRESIKKGFCAKKISMDKLQPYVRDIPEFEYAEFSGGAKFRNGDTIMARITPCLENGKIAKVNVLDSGEVGFGSTEFIVLRAEPEIMDENYLYYLVCSPVIRDQAIKSMVGSSGRQRVQIDVVKNIEIKLPDFNTQKKIGCLLKEIDDKIAINTKINNHLEQQAQLLFQSWFIDFEPFGGTMPTDWKWVTLDTIVDFQNGYAFKSKELLGEAAPNTYRVFKQGHIKRGGGFNPDGTKSWYPKESANQLSKFILHKDDVLMAMTDMKDNVAILGNTAIMPADNKYIVNQRVGLLRAKGNNGITYPFIYLLTNNKDFLTDLRSRANSGVQVNLSSYEIKASKTILAPNEVNEEFSSIVLPMIETILQNQLANEKLVLLRNTILPKLMSGELDVSNIDL